MGSWKTEQELAKDGLPQLLRELASALESGNLPEGVPGSLTGLPARDLRKLVLVAEFRDSGVSVRLKAKRAGEILAPAASKAKVRPAVQAQGTAQAQGKALAGRDKYRQLKNILQADFKALQAAAREGRLPGPERLESLLALAELMSQGEQPASGAARAEMAQASTAFLDDCQGLRRAFAARDSSALAEVLERLARRKAACHAQFREKER